MMKNIVELLLRWYVIVSCLSVAKSEEAESDDLKDGMLQLVEVTSSFATFAVSPEEFRRQLCICTSPEDCTDKEIVHPNDTKVTVQELIPGTTYAVCITNVDSSDSEVHCDIASSSCDEFVTSPLSLDRILVDTNETPNVTFYWTVKAAEPNVSYSIDDAVDWTEVPNNASSVTVENLLAWTTYTAHFRRCLSSNICSSATSVEFSTPIQAPTKVMNCDAKALSSEEIAISWEKPWKPNGPLHGYHIYQLDPDTGLFAERKTVSCQDNYLEVMYDDLEPWTDYTFKVYGYNVYRDETLQSEPVIVRTRTFPVEPGKVKDLQLVSTDSDSAKLFWNHEYDPEQGVVDFKVNYCIKSTQECDGQVTSSNEIKLNGLKPLTEYLVSVTAFNNYMDNEQAHEEPAEIEIKTTPPVPEDPVRINSRPSWVQVDFKHSPPFHYRVCSESDGVVSYSVSDTSVILQGLPPASETEIHFCLCSDDSCSSSKAVKIKTLSELPPPVTDVEIEPVSATSMKVSWNVDDDLKDFLHGFKITACTVGWKSRCTYRNVSAGVREHTMTGLNAYESYRISVQSYTTYGQRTVLTRSSLQEKEAKLEGQPTGPGNLHSKMLGSEMYLVSWWWPEDDISHFEYRLDGIRWIQHPVNSVMIDLKEIEKDYINFEVRSCRLDVCSLSSNKVLKVDHEFGSITNLTKNYTSNNDYIRVKWLYDGSQTNFKVSWCQYGRCNYDVVGQKMKDDFYFYKLIKFSNTTDCWLEIRPFYRMHSKFSETFVYGDAIATSCNVDDEENAE